jgi:hypothetical protein
MPNTDKDICEWEYRHPYWQSGCHGGTDMDLLEEWNGPQYSAWDYCPYCGGKIRNLDEEGE